MSISSNRTSWIAICLLIFVGSLVYSNTLDVPFYFDDTSNIQNPALRLETISFEQIVKAASSGTLTGRPVSNVSFAFNYYLGEYKVQGYHIVNIIIHLLAGVFLYLLLRATLNLPVNKRKYRNFSSLAYITALLWLVHPLATQSVTYIVQRMNSMASMFYILSVLLYVTGRNRQIRVERRKKTLPAWCWFLACVFSGLLSIGSKEIAATLPIVVLLYEWFFFRDVSWQWIREKLVWLAGGGLILGALSFYYVGRNPCQLIFNECSGRDFTAFERLLTQFRVIVHYISLLLYPNPSRLVFDYNIPFSTSLLTPVTTLYSFLGIILLLLLAILLSRRERLLSFCILWFLINLAIESSFICLEMVFEHRTYLPSMFFVLFITAFLYRIGKSNTLITLILVPVILLFGYWTFQRNKVWQNPVVFWKDSVEKYPAKPRSHNNLGTVLLHAKNVEQAGEEFRRALELSPNFPEAIHNLGLVAALMGNNRQAEQYYRRAILLRPEYLEPQFHLGELLWGTGREGQAVDQFREALNIWPDSPLLNKTYGRLLLRKGNVNQAMEYLRTALLRRSDDIELLLDIGEGLARLGMVEEAIEMYRKALDLNPNQAGGHYNLALLLLGQGKKAEALRHYRLAEEFGTSHVPVLYNLATLLYKMGNKAEAEKYFQKALLLAPELSDSYNNYGFILMEKGELVIAAKQFEAAIRINPGHERAAGNLKLIQGFTESRERR